MVKKEIHLSPLMKERIKELFYRTELRRGEKIIDNKDSTIAKELKLSKSQVSTYLQTHLRHKYRILNFKINSQK